MKRLVLGNRHASDSDDNGVTRRAAPRGKRATVVELDDDVNMADAFVAITRKGGIWDTHTQVTNMKTEQLESRAYPDDGAAGITPAWVSSEDTALATLVAAHYGGIETRDFEEPR